MISASEWRGGGYRTGRGRPTAKWPAAGDTNACDRLSLLGGIELPGRTVVFVISMILFCRTVFRTSRPEVESE
jgi:hypothetical protein